MSGSRIDRGSKGSYVGTRPLDDGDSQLIATASLEESRRRRFFDHAGRSRRPALHRRNAAPILPRTSFTTIVETIVDVSDDDRGMIDSRVPQRLAAADPMPSHGEQPTVPAVPKFPTFSNPTVPTVPPYPFNIPSNPSSQSILSSPPSSPAPSDTSFTPTPTATPVATSNATLSPESSSPSRGSPSDIPVPVTTTATASSIDASYFNITSTTNNSVPDGAVSTSLISSSDRTTFSTRASNSLPQATSGSNLPGAAATTSATGTAPVSIATSDTSSDTGTSSGNSVGPNTPQVVGGVVGGIAGLAVVLLVLLFLLRRYRRHLQDRGELLENNGSDRDLTNTMSMRSSHTPLVAAVAASIKKMRPGSSQTTGTGETGTSDRGFQRVAGRKIEPVLVTGGDGYGGNYGAFEKETGISKETGMASSSNPEAQLLAGTSSYRDTTDFYSRHSSRTSTPTGEKTRFMSENRDFADGHDDYNRGPSPDVIAVIRPSPARSPVTTSAGPSRLAPPQTSGPTLPSDAPPTPTLPSRFIPDGVGRSLVSQDGSRGSRFTESV